MKNWKRVICIFLTVVLLGGVLALCLWEREPQGDTDPNAPFVDLPDRTKKEVLEAVEKKLAFLGRKTYWYNDTDVPQTVDRTPVMYYGTFKGYHIAMAAYPNPTGGKTPHAEYYGDYAFCLDTSFDLFACKDGVAVWLRDAYVGGLLGDEQIGQIYQCFNRYNEEIYIIHTEEKESQ